MKNLKNYFSDNDFSKKVMYGDEQFILKGGKLKPNHRVKKVKKYQ